MFKKRFALFITSLILGLTLIASPTASAITIGGPSDCDDNAIIKCGVHSTNSLVDSYRSSSYVRKVFAHFGITAAEIARLPDTNVAGRVTKDGKVFVDGQSEPVATGAVTGGRQNMPGSTKVNVQGAVFYKRPPSASFQQDSLPTFVSMKDGVFQFAVIASCGNAVHAIPTSKPAPQKAAVASARPVSKAKQQQPAPAPKKPAAVQPTQTQSQTQTQTVEQNVTQNQEVTVNNTTTAAAPETVSEAPAQETVAAAPAEESGGKESLPNVGTGGTLGIFSASSILGALGFRRYLIHLL